MRAPELSNQIAHLDRAIRRLVWAILFAAFLFGGIYLYQSDDFIAAGLMGAAAFFTFVWLYLKR